MDLRALLVLLLTCVLYPAWLAAGAADYVCHRRSRIAETSGAEESEMHVAQFVLLAVALAMTLFLQVTAAVFICVCALVIAHTAVAYMDVRYTQGRRHITPFEQQVHGFMDVIPLIAVCLVGVLNWDSIDGTSPGSWFQLEQPVLDAARSWLMLGSFLVLSGAPVLEEWFRARRAGLTSASPPSYRTPSPAPRTR